MPIFFDLGKRMCQRAYFAIFSCKTAQKFRRPHYGRLTLPLVSLPLLRKPPVAGEGAFASFRPVGARAAFSARAPRASFFRPASRFLARLYPFESAVHRVVAFVRVRRSMPWLINLARQSSWPL